LSSFAISRPREKSRTVDQRQMRRRRWNAVLSEAATPQLFFLCFASGRRSPQQLWATGMMVPATQQRPGPPPRQQPRERRWLRRLLWGMLSMIAVVLLLPYLLVPLYRVVNPVSTLMLWRWANGARVERSFVPIERMAPALPVTVIAAEDGRFCRHRGIDWQELRDRLEDVDDISEARGVSTITQQTAKNLFLWPGRSMVRKALELPLALWIDFVLPKWRVLEIYLNIAEWGPTGQFGAEAASRYAFNKSVRALSPREAALLASVLPNPRRRSAKQPGPVVRRLAGLYEARSIAQAPLATCVNRLRP
jgi:monofunctional biosynthetic peptidoglycan transglycosylase